MSIPRLSPTEQHILELLIANGDMYGLEMVKASGHLKRGTVYVTLNRMESEKGLVESYAQKDPHESGMARRRYHVTGHGQRVLAAWQLAQTAWEATP